MPERMPLHYAVLAHPWTGTAIVALLAMLLAYALHRAVWTVLARAIRSAIVPSAILRATQRPAAIAWPLFALQLVLQGAPNDLRGIDPLRHGCGLLLIAALTVLAMRAISGFADGVIERHPADVEDNLAARSIQTQARVLSRSAMVLVLIAGTAMALMTFPGARQLGASLLASAGVIGIIGGLAARPVFSNLIAGLQIALAQPIRLDDVLIVQGEWGRVEEITGTYVVLRIWDERRLIIPLQWFIENPFQNWTRSSSQILGTVFLYLDYSAPLEAIRAEAKRITEASAEWDKRVFGVQVTDATERAMQVRILVSAANSGAAFDLRCKLREGVLAFLAREHPHCLPQVRLDAQGELSAARADGGLAPQAGLAGST
jgi:small-conductance mechanosensitive channel